MLLVKFLIGIKMKLIKKVKVIIAGLLLASSSLASAGIITVEGIETDALQLSTSFEEFYNFGNGNLFSANTGLEQANSVIGFFAETSSDLALFLIFGGPGGAAGFADFDISASDGAVTFADDSAEMPSGSNVIFNYARNRTDGLIFSGISDALWSINISFNALSGINNLIFYSFDDNGDSSIVFETNGVPDSLSISGTPDLSNVTQVSSPATVLLMLSAFGLLLFRRK